MTSKGVCLGFTRWLLKPLCARPLPVLFNVHRNVTQTCHCVEVRVVAVVVVGVVSKQCCMHFYVSLNLKL